MPLSGVPSNRDWKYGVAVMRAMGLVRELSDFCEATGRRTVPREQNRTPEKEVYPSYPRVHQVLCRGRMAGGSESLRVVQVRVEDGVGCYRSLRDGMIDGVRAMLAV